MIAVNAGIIGERPTGLGVFALNIVEALNALGERLLVYTSLPGALRRREVEVRWLPAAARPERGARGHLVRLLWTQTDLRVRLMRERPALLLNLMPDGVFFPPVPQIATIHDLIPLQYTHDHPRQQHYFRYYVAAIVRHSRAVITISEASRRDIIRMYGVTDERVHVVPCGYDPVRFNPDGPPLAQAGIEPYALYVGNVMPSKNLLRLVDAFATATRLQRGRLIIRGRGKRQHTEALRARIIERGIENRVDWQPYVSAEELPGLYRGARMLLLPSLSEGFGLTALEAMACGTPVVASTTSSLPEVVGEAGLLVDPHDSAALADTIGRLFSDDRLAKELRERGLERAPRFTWARAGRAAQEVIRSVLTGPV